MNTLTSIAISLFLIAILLPLTIFVIAFLWMNAPWVLWLLGGLAILVFAD